MSQVKIINRFMPVLAFMVICANSLAQNNIYKIDDEVFAYYARGEKLRTSKECLAYCDTAVAIAKRKGDLKGECVALTLPIRHYFHMRDVENLDKAAEYLRKVSLKNGYINYYYFAYTQQIDNYLNCLHMDEAIDAAHIMRKEAEERNDDYGVYQSLKIAGDIYKVQGNRGRTLSAYSEAVQYFKNSKELTENQSIAVAYSFLIKEFTANGMADSIAVHKEIAMAMCRNAQDSLRILSALANNAGANWRKEDFYHYLDQMKAIAPNNALTSQRYDYLEWMDAYFKGDSQRAEDIINKIDNYHDRTLMLARLYYQTGRYKESADKYYELKKINQEKVAALTIEQATRYEALLGTDRVRLEAQEARQKNLIIMAILMTLALTVIIILLLVNKESLRKANNMKTAFIQNMSHEVRTPLNAIIGFSQLLLLPDGMLSEEEKAEYGNYILNNSHMLTMLIDDILDTSDIERGRYKVNLSPVACNDVCRSAMSSVSYRVQAGVEMEFSTEVEDSFVVETDGKRVQQILINFLTNACKNTSSGSIKVHCSLSENPGSIRFSVTDTGCGIPEDKSDEIFKRFAKLDSFKQGSGLGLSICSEIAKRLGGKIQLDKSYRDGARFYLDLPIISR